jgi:hypothetical protein
MYTVPKKYILEEFLEIYVFIQVEIYYYHIQNSMLRNGMKRGLILKLTI